MGRRPFKELRNLLVRKPHRFLPPNVPELRIPGDAAAVALLDEMLQDVREIDGDDGLRALRATVESPAVRVASLPGADGSRDYTLLAAVSRDEECWRVVVLQVRVGSREHRSLISVRCRLLRADDRDGIRAELTAAYRDAEGRHDLRLQRWPAVLWLRGARASDAPPEWAVELEALAATFGVRAKIVSDPDVKPDTVVGTLSSSDPARVVVWDHDGRGTELAARAGLQASTPAAEIAYGGWSAALSYAGRMFGELSSAPPPVRAAPRTPAEAVALAPTHPDVIVLAAARSSADASVFRRPLDVLVALEELVSAVAGGALTAPGGLPAALAGGSFRYASGVSATAHQQFTSEYERTYKGATVLLGPHLKLGAGSAEHTLRIYWYVDDSEHKLVIGHIGRHLSDAGS